MLDVAVHADSAAMDDPAHARRRGGVNQIANRGGVHGAIGRRWDAGLPIHRRDVVDDFNPVDGPGKRCPIFKGADRRFDACGFEVTCLRRLPDKASDLIPACGERSREMSTCEAGRTSD